MRLIMNGYANATLDFDYAELDTIKRALDLYHTAAQLQYSDSIEMNRLRLNIGRVMQKMTDDLQEDFKA